MGLALLQFPTGKGVAQELRDLADAVEQGAYGDAHNLAWVIDAGDSCISVCLMGNAAAPGAEANLLLAIGQHKILRGCYP